MHILRIALSILAFIPTGVAAEPSEQRITIENPSPDGTRVSIQGSGETSPAPRFLVASDPIGWLRDAYALSFSYAPSKHVALRADASVVDTGAHAAETWQFGLSVPIYFDRAFDGPFVEPGLAVSRTNHSRFSAGALGPVMTEHAIGPTMYVGWQWSFRSRLSVAGAIGARMGGPSSTGTVGGIGVVGSTYDIGAHSYVRVGYAF